MTVIVNHLVAKPSPERSLSHSIEKEGQSDGALRVESKGERVDSKGKNSY